MIGERRVSLRNDPAFLIALLYTIAFVGMVFIVVLFPVVDRDDSVVQQTLSIMSIIQTAIVSYYFGSSKTAVDTNKGTSVHVEDNGSAVTVKPETKL